MCVFISIFMLLFNLNFVFLFYQIFNELIFLTNTELVEEMLVFDFQFKTFIFILQILKISIPDFFFFLCFFNETLCLQINFMKKSKN